VITRNGKHKNGVHILDGMPQTLAHGAEEGATKLAEAVEIAGARVAKGAGQASGAASELSGQLKGQASGLSGQLKGQASELSGQLKGQAGELSGQLRGQAGELSGQLKGRAAHAPIDIKDAKRSVMDAKRTVKDAGLSMRKARLGASESMVKSLMSRSMTKRRARLLPSTDAMLKAQLAKTTRELAHESSDLNAAVDSLNQIIKSNRKAAAKSRTRLLGGAALGVVVMYHLDTAQGRQRRAASARMITGMVRGQRRAGAPPGAV
jgi:uncharacterized protein YjbJ (UPF0337 family)